MEKTRFYSINGKGKYLINEKLTPDSNRMIKAYNFNTSKNELVKKSLLRPWKNPVGVKILRGGRY